jgi:glycine/D-amino acid oxidase-like deaminating enzyme
VDQTPLSERVDVLVVGGGMARLAAATGATENGARVLVIEKGSRPGGSVALSVGMFWAVPDFETLRRRLPLGNGLWAAGVGAGGLSNWTYAGGLALALMTGWRVAASALVALAPASEPGQDPARPL